MNDFTVQRVVVPEHLRPAGGVLRVNALAVTSDAAQLAAQMVQQAQAEAAHLREHAVQQAQHDVAHQQQEIARRGSELLEGLQQARDELLERIEELVVDLAQEVMDRLLLELTPRERITAALRRVRQEAPPKLNEAILWVHSDDQEQLPASPWEVQTDPTLAPGSCRLEASSGEWRSDFSLATQALRAALAGAAIRLKQQAPS
jgi:flagellar biosynthesis/type III secretory pathway protein FliH